jgi:hypothetical protein
MQLIQKLNPTPHDTGMHPFGSSMMRESYCDCSRAHSASASMWTLSTSFRFGSNSVSRPPLQNSKKMLGRGAKFWSRHVTRYLSCPGPGPPKPLTRYLSCPGPGSPDVFSLSLTDPLTLVLSIFGSMDIHLLPIAAFQLPCDTCMMQSHFLRSKHKRCVGLVREVCAILCGLTVASDYAMGQQLIKDKDYKANAEFFQRVFEVGAL